MLGAPSCSGGAAGAGCRTACAFAGRICSKPTFARQASSPCTSSSTSTWSSGPGCSSSAPFRAPQRLEQIGEAVLAHIANQVRRPSHHLRSATRRSAGSPRNLRGRAGARARARTTTEAIDAQAHRPAEHPRPGLRAHRHRLRRVTTAGRLPAWAAASFLCAGPASGSTAVRVRCRKRAMKCGSRSARQRSLAPSCGCSRRRGNRP
jgi:hypothetical protein